MTEPPILSGPILLVHDDADVRAVMAAELRRAGFGEIVEAADGEQGLAAALARLPRLVIADIHMPGLDGFQLCRVLAGAGDGLGIPVILVSASYRDPAAARLAGDLGAAAYVDAPYRPGALREAVARVLAARPTHPLPSPSARVLVVEDEPDVATVVRTTLESRGYVVEHVADGNAVLAAAALFRPDMVLLDYNLPGRTGLDALRELRRHGIDAGAVVLSAFVDVPLTVEFVRAGAEDVLPKPFEPGRLLAAIGRGLERRAMHLRAAQFRERLEAVRRSEARCQSLIDCSRDVIAFVDHEGRLCRASPATAALTGRLVDDLAGTPALDLFAPDSRERLQHALDAPENGEEFDGDLLGADGAVIPLSVRVQALREDGWVAGHWLVGRDLRRQRALSQQLAQAEKRAGVMRLVTGISHEFSGLVAGLLGHVSLGLESPDVLGEREALFRIRDAGTRAADLLEAMRAVVHAAPGGESIDAAALTRQTAAAEAARFAEAGVRLVVQVAPDLPPLAGRPEAVRRVLAELLSNARHACVEAGGLAVTELRVRASHAGQVVFEVRDQGPGIAPADLGNVFDPFFTTKGALGGRVHEGKLHGTGLGLAIARAIAEAHGGGLDVGVLPEGGTCATLRLPAAAPVKRAAPV